MDVLNQDPGGVAVSGLRLSRLLLLLLWWKSLWPKHYQHIPAGSRAEQIKWNRGDERSGRRRGRKRRRRWLDEKKRLEVEEEVEEEVESLCYGSFLIFSI